MRKHEENVSCVAPRSLTNVVNIRRVKTLAALHFAHRRHQLVSACAFWLAAR